MVLGLEVQVSGFSVCLGFEFVVKMRVSLGFCLNVEASTLDRR